MEKNMIRLACPNCMESYEVPDAMAGRKTRCSECWQLLEVLPPQSVKETSPGSVAAPRDEQLPDGSNITFKCDNCSKSYSVPADKAGKRTKCAKCSQPLTVPSPSGGPAPLASDEMLTKPQTDMPEKRESRLRPCPDCEREVSRRASQCPHCGCPLEQTNQPPVTGMASTEPGPDQNKEKPPPLLSDGQLEELQGMLRQRKAARQQDSAGESKLQEPTPESVPPTSEPTPSSASQWAVLLWVIGGLLLLLACVPAMSLFDHNRTITESDRVPNVADLRRDSELF
jgi:hypothetical protein